MCASPALAGPIASARYDGRDATHKRAFLLVTKDARAITEFGFATRTRCSDGKRRPLVYVSPRRRSTAILADGSFKETTVAGRDRGTVSGQFDQTGNTVTGIYSIVIRTRRYTCRTGDVTYTLHRDGTAGASFRNALTASGLYSASGRGLKLRMRPLVPAGVIHSFRVTYASRCSSGETEPWELRLLVPLVKGSRFGAIVRDRHRRKSGTTDTTRAEILGKFTYTGGYRVAGAIKARNVIRRPGQRPDVCKATIPFTGRFVRGPLGEEGPHPES